MLELATLTLLPKAQLRPRAPFRPNPDEPNLVSSMSTAYQRKSNTLDRSPLRSALRASFDIVSVPVGSAISSLANDRHDADSLKS